MQIIHIKQKNNMTPEQFAYWLQGFFELHDGTPFTKREQMINDHLKEVFCKKTPDRKICQNQLAHNIPFAPYLPYQNPSPLAPYMPGTAPLDPFGDKLTFIC